MLCWLVNVLHQHHNIGVNTTLARSNTLSRLCWILGISACALRTLFWIGHMPCAPKFPQKRHLNCTCTRSSKRNHLNCALLRSSKMGSFELQVPEILKNRNNFNYTCPMSSKNMSFEPHVPEILKKVSFEMRVFPCLKINIFEDLRNSSQHFGAHAILVFSVFQLRLVSNSNN